MPDLRPVTDEEFRALLSTARAYSLVLLRHGPNYDAPDAGAVILEHAKRNMQLREAGILSIVMPVRDDSGLAGVGVFSGTVEETWTVIEGDPAVIAGVLVAEVHQTSSFPGDALPG